ncbi:unnamed protein product [Heligmosomoides polygyrus]|uniref:Uncharacterized protein n=1 Tax=Heligmosomoides polygyrus TaxID=6339 RepID=A0A183FPT7_HELPZ|nr:unnamed protein product [Heligmosomoides polygyrus]
MSSSTSPPRSPFDGMQKVLDNVFLEEPVPAEEEEIALDSPPLTSQQQQQFLSADYPPLAEPQISVDNQGEALEVLTTHKSSITTDRTPFFERDDPMVSGSCT